MKRERGITLVECLVAAMVLITLAALLIPACLRSGRHAEVVGCRAHLATLYKASQGAPAGTPPLGTSYWTRLAKTSPPLVEPGTLRCPLVPAGIKIECDYLGPRRDPAGLAATDLIGCDAADNHGDHGRQGGNVLLKSGTILTLHPLEPGATADPWREAYQEKCVR